MKILALLDGRPGNDNQTIAIAEQLGNYDSLKVEFGFWSKLPNLLLGKSLIGVKTPIDAYSPDIVIAAGRKLGRVAAHIKAKTGAKAFQLMNPQTNFSNFDITFVPIHDDIIQAKGLYTTFGAPNRIDQKLLDKNEGPFPALINVALIGDVSVAELKDIEKVKNLYITTSRRTKPETIAALRALNPTYIYEWSADSENPYYALLASAKNIIVSADSVGMISEACTTGKNVYIFGIPKKEKFENFINRLLMQDYAKTMHDFGVTWEAKKLATRDYVVKIIKNYIES